MSWGLLNAAMLVGLVGAAVPVLIHLLHRRQDQVVDWGAMQFLDAGERARRSIQLTEILLLLARMALLAIVALALARPFWTGSRARAEGGASGSLLGGMSPPRDVVIILDGSESMNRRAGGTTPRTLAVAWIRKFLKELHPGDSVAVLIAGSRVRRVVDPPSFDMAKVDATLAGLRPSRGSSDLPAALADAFGVLERTQNPAREVVILTDGQRDAWRPGDASRWSLLRDLQHRLTVPPRIWAVSFDTGVPPDGPNGSLGPLTVSRTLVSPGLPISISATMTNAGPGSLTRTAELTIDGHAVPGSAQVVGPVPDGGKIPVTFRTTLLTPGAHLVSVRLAGGTDAQPGDDESSIPVEVSAAIPVLLVDGEPGLEPLSSETDFVRAALTPTGDDTPQVRTTTVPVDRLSAETLRGQRVVVLANVERLAADQAAAIGRFLDAGGGLLIAPGDRADADFYNAQGWLPARFADLKRNEASKDARVHPAPSSFTGPLMTSFAQGETPPLAEADFEVYRMLAPMPEASVVARLDTGDPWVVERSQGKAHVLLLATPLDAEVGTLPVNPDFVPLVHEWVVSLAGGGGAARALRPGEPAIFDLPFAPSAAVKTLPVQTPGGQTVDVPVLRNAGSARVRLEDTSEPGVYRLSLPDPPGGSSFASVAGDDREGNPAQLESGDRTALAQGWPLVFETDPTHLSGRLLAAKHDGPREIWRGLILAVLGGLCLEVYLTRRLVQSQGPG